MNKRNQYEAEVCGKVPLHQTNLIQPHGVLLIVDAKDFTILQLSENASFLFQKELSEVATKPLFDFIGAKENDKFRERFHQGFSGKLPFTFSFPAGEFLATVQNEGGVLIIEVENEKRSAAKDNSFLDMYQEIKFIMAAIEAAPTTAEVCKVAVRELKNISGFDKVMIYQFDHNWNGDVIAEAAEEGMDRYLGLKFPASDIPKQARDLYQKTPYRLIPNRDYTPVRLYPVLNPLTNAFTNLSASNLRSVASVHLEYLKNMGVVASMSTRILVDGKLWGLIACHHRSAKYLSYELCSVFELLSNLMSARIAAVQKQDVFAFKSKMQELYAGLLEDVYKQEDISVSLQNNPQELLNLLSADGVAFTNGNKLITVGITPEETDITEMMMWLQSTGNSGVFQSTNLASIFEPSERYSKVASGILVLPIIPERGNYILAFRPEAVQKVNWGGNPDEALQFEEGGKKYHPRNSFSEWQETVRNTSVAWNREELETAEVFRSFVMEYTLNNTKH